MFTKKKDSLITKKPVSSTNAFVAAATSTVKTPSKAAKKAKAATTSLGNGALKYTTTGDAFCDQFGKASNYKAPRTYADIAKDMETLYEADPNKAIRMALYLRMITRKVKMFDGTETSTTQRGQGLKHEGIFRMIWLAINEPTAFWNNVHLLVSVGSWKDIFTMLSYDLQYNGWNSRKLDWEKFKGLILAGLENPQHSQLLKKYLPQIKTNSKCTTLESQADNLIAKWVCSFLFGNKESSSTYKQYRKLKTSGTAHEWQKLISKGQMLKINFDSIHGRALALLVSSKFLENNNLEDKYQEWIEKQPVAKYTGYVYELVSTVKTKARTMKEGLRPYQISTFNKQFDGLVQVGKNGMNTDSMFIVAVDSSASMESPVPGTNVSAYSVAISMALYFSYLLKGPFADHFFEFSNGTIFKSWKGKTPFERLKNEKSSIIGGTNFLSIANKLAEFKNKGVPESDFPTGVLCVSDGCFNSTPQNKTNFKSFKDILKQVGFSKKFVDNFKIVLWDVPNNFYGKAQTAFEDFADAPNLFHISGLDPAAVAFLTGTTKSETTPKNTYELVEEALNQEILNFVQ